MRNLCTASADWRRYRGSGTMARAMMPRGCCGSLARIIFGRSARALARRGRPVVWSARSPCRVMNWSVAISGQIEFAGGDAVGIGRQGLQDAVRLAGRRGRLHHQVERDRVALDTLVRAEQDHQARLQAAQLGRLEDDG